MIHITPEQRIILTRTESCTAKTSSMKLNFWFADCFSFVRLPSSRFSPRPKVPQSPPRNIRSRMFTTA